MSLEEEKEICNQAFLLESNKYKDKILPDNRIETIFVRHVMNNLMKGLNDDLMTLKSIKNVDELSKSIVGGNIVADDFSVRMSGEKQEDDKPVPFEIFVIEDDTIMNAVSFGMSKKILVFTGWLNIIEYDEEYLSVTLAHEIGHIIQRHANTARTLLWPILSVLGPLINDYLNAVTQELVESYGSGRYNQKEEKEADIIGLQIMALSGYHPKKAVELWEYISNINQRIKQMIDEEDKNKVDTLVLPSIGDTTNTDNSADISTISTQDTRKPHIILENISEFFSSHPMETVRAKYLVDFLPEAEGIYENVVANGGKARLFSLAEYGLENPIEGVKRVEEWLVSKIWNGIKCLIGL
ncbi:15250_t:CDS:2 [Acaulospora colombiana]|uniref:15250_t:CDS:1 n=1 Tax=Acaulospora colombiana TaxID=27376 RepID=A0ACA9M6C0_9GLOM|nr:15250_t:CDS:2 [Acaulospora colombiana]